MKSFLAKLNGGATFLSRVTRFSTAPKGDATFLSRVTKCLTTAMLSLATLLLTGSAGAVTPVVVWNGDFGQNNLSKTGTDNQTYTLSVNQNTIAEDGSYVLMKTGTNGIYVDWTTGIGAATVIFRCENVPTEIVAGMNSCYATVYNTSSQNRVGAVRRPSDGKMQGIWANSLWGNSPVADFPTSAGKQIYALAYKYDAGTLFCCNVDGNWTPPPCSMLPVLVRLPTTITPSRDFRFSAIAARRAI